MPCFCTEKEKCIKGVCVRESPEIQITISNCPCKDERQFCFNNECYWVCPFPLIRNDEGKEPACIPPKN